jgi:uncharacterized membrane protein
MLLDGYRRWLTIAGIAGTGLMSGLFFAYSTFTMTGLRRLPGDQGLRGMQAINRAANSSATMIVTLLGTGVVAVVLGVGALRDLDRTASVLQLVAGGLYVGGVLVVTFAYHVPRNEALGLVDPTGAGAVDAWRRYAGPWVAWNHVRTIAPLGSTILYALSLRSTS